MVARLLARRCCSHRLAGPRVAFGSSSSDGCGLGGVVRIALLFLVLVVLAMVLFFVGSFAYNPVEYQLFFVCINADDIGQHFKCVTVGLVAKVKLLPHLVEWFLSL